MVDRLILAVLGLSGVWGLPHGTTPTTMTDLPERARELFEHGRPSPAKRLRAGWCRRVGSDAAGGVESYPGGPVG